MPLDPGLLAGRNLFKTSGNQIRAKCFQASIWHGQPEQVARSGHSDIADATFLGKGAGK